MTLLPWAITQKAASDTPYTGSVDAEARWRTQPLQRLHGPIVRDGPRDPLDQLVTV